ncbi:MAG: CPBP family intramembrane metalloprotease [Bacteroides sp.]|nr:CPBP family intramembrane metalloprotease [Bacteroides sp.]
MYETSPQSTKPLVPIWASLVLYMISCVVVMGVLMSPLYFLPKPESMAARIGWQCLQSLISLTSVTACAIFFTKVLDRRPVSSIGFSIKGRWKDCIAGFMFATVLYVIGFGLSLGLGAVEITSVQFNGLAFFGSLLFYFIAASMEEVMMRGYFQGLLMTKLNRFASLAIASLVFSLLHAFNDNVTFFSLFNLFLAGLLLGASYMYTRNLWFPIVLHTAWNWIQGSVLGFGVSGSNMFPSVLTLNLPEPNILNGGSFGFEGSIICSFLCMLGTVAIIYYYDKSFRSFKFRRTSSRLL